MKKQTVVRTRKMGNSYAYEPKAFANLSEMLNDCWLVVMVNPIGDELEYILEKEI